MHGITQSYDLKTKSFNHEYFRPFEMLAMYNDVSWALWMEPSGVLMAIDLLLVSIHCAHTHRCTY